MVKPITLYGHATGPNPWKVAIILEELNIPYETNSVEMPDMKKEPYEKICVNGRVPAIEDPNTGITLWESGAIIEYLAETYDKEDKLSFSSAPDKYYQSQWIHFQMSEQGPYFGQAAWFAKFHPERIESATERYFDQVKRIFYVLNKALEGKQYLVGDKCFLTWDAMIPFIFGDRASELNIEQKYPNYFAWNKRLNERPLVKKVLAAKAKASGH